MVFTICQQSGKKPSSRPVISKSKSMFESIRQQGFLTATSNAVQAFLRSPASWFSWRGGLVTFLLLLASGLILRLHPLAHFLRAVQSLVTRFSEKQRTRRSVIRFYARFCGLCEQYGMQLSAVDKRPRKRACIGFAIRGKITNCRAS